MSYCTIAPGHPLHGPYHDREYGFPISDDAALFERLVLEINQAGLSWLTILNKRDNFRQAFDRFDLDTVAAYGSRDRDRLLADPGIIRNRLKVDAAIENAKRLIEIRAESRIVRGLARRQSSTRQARLGEAVQTDFRIHRRRNHWRVFAQHRLSAGRAR